MPQPLRVVEKGMAQKKEALLTEPVNPFVFELMVVCDACGSLMKGEWVKPEGGRQMVIAVDKCNCNSPLMQGEDK